MKPDDYKIQPQMRKKVTAVAVQRPKTNLVPNMAFALSKDQMQSGFMGVFHKKYEGDARKALIKIALAPIMNTTVISLGKRPSPKGADAKVQRKAENAAIGQWNVRRKENNLHQYTTLKKVNGSDPHFILNLPIMMVNSPTSLDAIMSMFSGVTLTDEARQEVESFFGNEHGGDTLFPAGNALERAGLSQETRHLFAPCLLGVRYLSNGAHLIISLEFKVRKEEAEQMVSTDWLEIRPVDLYPLFSMWVEAEYVAKDYGKSATSLSRIAETLPKHDPEDIRVDKFNVGITMDGDPVWIPKALDNTQKYESMLVSSNVGEGGVFAMRTLADTNKKPNLPINVPILVDWVNNKFAYSNINGKLEVMPLEHVRKCTSSMAMNLLHRPLPDKFVESLQRYAKICNISIIADHYWKSDVNSADKPTDIDGAVKDAISRMKEEHGEGAYPRYIDLTADVENDEDRAAWLPITYFVRALHTAMVKNVDAVYAIYAVSSVTTLLGWLSVLSEYGGVIDTTRAEANSINAIPKSQGLDPNWTPPDAPMLTAKFGDPSHGFLPHQARMRNMLRDSPPFAMLSVDAGGGKSLLSITDILYEIKANRSAPYLIMCPSHLIANYVSEIVEFTDGKINVIPITSYNFGTTGIARYEEILKAAPINTILVVDYDALKFRGRATVYGTTAITVYPIIDMIRQFKPGYVMMDESHFLRNAGNARSQSVMSLIADIPKKRVASGTLNPDSPSDLPGQVALLDPTIFGTRENFNNTYGQTIKSSRVLLWKDSGPNAVSTVIGRLQNSIVWCQAKRKEWAIALPERKDYFAPVKLTNNQRIMYEAIFDDMIQQLRAEAEKKPSTKKLLEKLDKKPGDKKKKASEEDEADFGGLSEVQEDDEQEDMVNDDGDLGAALQPFLCDIERFVTDPASHPYSKNGVILANGDHVPPLSGDDLKSPKAVEMEKIMRHYLSGESPAKVLIFVNYNQSADSLFAAMPADLQAVGLLYKSDTKVETLNQFKTDKKIKWMIGIRNSLEVGLNLQHAGCLIRIEGCWTPGEQEQGDSRIARPYFGPGGDKRKALEFYTIVANKTIDITKAARLRAKIVAVAKFENAKNEDYKAIPDIPIIPMTLDAIQNQNDFDENVTQYRDSMAQLNRVIKEEIAEYKAQIESEGGFHPVQVKQAPTPGNAALLARVPYAKGTELYSASELGLVRMDNYMGLELGNEDEDMSTGTSTGEKGEEGAAAVRAQRMLVLGKRCHTEFGDGVVSGAMSEGGKSYVSRCAVSLDDGTTVDELKTTNVFIITRTETNSVDMRNMLARASGLPILGPITVPSVYSSQTRVTQKELKEQERLKAIEEAKAQKKLRDASSGKKKLSIGLQLSVLNGYLRFSYVEGKDTRAQKALEALGFKIDPHYYYTRVKSYKHLLTQANNWAKAGFDVSNQVDNDTFDILYRELQSNAMASHKHYERMISKGNFQNYLRKAWKPLANKKVLNMFALVTDGGDKDPAAIKEASRAGVPPHFGAAYLCLPYGAGQPGSKVAISSKYKAPSTVWKISSPTLSVFVGNMAGVHHVLTQIREAGISVTNIDELNKEARSVKKVSAKDDETVDVRLETELEPVARKKRAVEPEPVARKKRAVEPEVPVTRKKRAVEPEPVRKQRAVEPRMQKVTRRK